MALYLENNVAGNMLKQIPKKVRRVIYLLYIIIDSESVILYYKITDSESIKSIDRKTMVEHTS